MEDRVYDLLEKLYIEMQKGFVEIRGEVNEVRGEVNELHGNVNEIRGNVNEIRGEIKEVWEEIKEVREEMNKKFVNLENKLDINLKALYDGYQQNTESINRVETKVADLSKKIDKHDIEIKVIKNA